MFNLCLLVRSQAILNQNMDLEGLFFVQVVSPSPINSEYGTWSNDFEFVYELCSSLQAIMIQIMDLEGQFLFKLCLLLRSQTILIQNMDLERSFISS